MLSPSYEQTGASQAILAVRHRSVEVTCDGLRETYVSHSIGATFRFMTGRTLGQPEKACATAMDSERPFPFLFPDPESEQHPSHIGCHPSATNPAVEPTNGVEHFTVKVEPYFVRSTASASEILTNVAIQDMLAAEELDFYELSCGPASGSSLSSVPEPSGSFDFVYPLASAESFDSYSEQVNWSPRRGSPEVSPEVSPDSPDQYGALTWGSSRPVYINDTMRFISSSEVEVSFRNTYPDSPTGEDDDDEDEEEVIIIPILRRTSSSFPHPHCLSTIPEEDEDDGEGSFGLDETYDDEDASYGDDTSSIETIRCTRIPERARLDIEFVWPSDGVEHL